MFNKENKIFLLYIVFVLIFLVSTTNYLSQSDIINVAGQMDVLSYTEISKYAPSLPSENTIILKHIAQRFFIPYLAGLISYYTNVELFLIFKILTYLSILTFIIINFSYLNKSDYNIKEKILFFSFLFLNPYIVRHHIFQPVQAHDMIFFCFSFLFVNSILNNDNKKILFFGTIPIFFRQTAIALFIGAILTLLKNKKYILFIILLIIFLTIFRFISNISNEISIYDFNFRYAYGIFFYDFSQIEKLIRFLLLPLVSFFPLFIFFFSKKKNNIDIKNIIIILFVIIMMIGQPILGGPDNSLRNVVRITTLCYPILVVVLFYSLSLKSFILNTYLYYIYIAGLFFWSLHPTFSKFTIFSFLRF